MALYRGVFPVLPTTFDEQGNLDLDSQKRAIAFLLDAGADGVCVLANWAEQFALAEDEREQLTRLALDETAGRVPVVVTTSHFSTRVAVERSRRAQAAGASMVMLMPPYHGATVRADEQGIYEHFRALDEALNIPIMIQDAPMSGVSLSVAFLARLAQELEHVQYAKIEVSDAAQKIRGLVAAAGEALPGPWDGEEGLTLLADLDAGATGTMPSAVAPELLRKVVDAHVAGRREEAIACYERVLPLLLYENRHVGIAASKVLMKAGGIIASDAMRHPLGGVPEVVRNGLIEHARRCDALVLRWAP